MFDPRRQNKEMLGYFIGSGCSCLRCGQKGHVERRSMIGALSLVPHGSIVCTLASDANNGCGRWIVCYDSPTICFLINFQHIKVSKHSVTHAFTSYFSCVVWHCKRRVCLQSTIPGNVLEYDRPNVYSRECIFLYCCSLVPRFFFFFSLSFSLSFSLFPFLFFSSCCPPPVGKKCAPWLA